MIKYTKMCKRKNSYFFLLLSIIIFTSCKKEEVQTTVYSVKNQEITAFVLHHYQVGSTIYPPYSQEVDLLGYDLEQVQIKFNSVELTEKTDFNKRCFYGEIPFIMGQTTTLDIKIGTQTVSYSAKFPDSLYFTNINFNAYIPADSIFTLRWNNSSGSDYYFLKIVCVPTVNMFDVVYDSSFVVKQNYFTIPSQAMIPGSLMFIDLYAVSGPDAGVTNISNLLSPFRGRIYFYSHLNIGVTITGSGQTISSIDNKVVREYLEKITKSIFK